MDNNEHDVVEAALVTALNQMGTLSMVYVTLVTAEDP